MRTSMSRHVAIAMALMVAAPVAARDLPVPADKGWQHAETGLILPARLDGLGRTQLTDSTDSERDIAAGFADAARSEIATVYLFHPSIDSVPMWFDRAEAAIGTNAMLGTTAPSTPDPLAFVPPTGQAASGLRRVYRTSKSGFRATGLAVLPMGDWLVAVRVSRTDGDLAALDAAVSRIVAAIRWPAKIATRAPDAVPIRPCAKPVAWKKAKLRKPEMNDAIGGALLGIVAQQAADRSTAAPKTTVDTPPLWCRDDASTDQYGVYRTDTGAGYVVALGDAGRSISVTEGLSAILNPGAGPRMSIMLDDVDDSRSTYGTFDALPRPDQAVDLVLHGQPQSRGRGKQITIGIPAR